MGVTNQLLAKAGVLLRAGQGSFWDEHTYGIRLSKHRGKPEAGLWFRTRGCRFAQTGTCVMCDYGKGPRTTGAEDMVEFVRHGLGALPEGLYHLLVSPIGSFFDTWEVPLQAQRAILRQMAGTDIETFAFESRAETIAEEAIAQCRLGLENRGLKVYLGLESADPWISKYCINKALSMDSFEQAVRILRQHDVVTSANVLLGAPFLSPLEAIEDVLQSISWAFAKGIDECNLFPTHVKEWTLLHWLSQRNLYSPPSLWSLVEVLRRVGPEVACSKIKFSWYKTYGSTNVVYPPITCSACLSDVIYCLDLFYETNDYAWIDRLVSFDCRCKDAWRSQLEARPSMSLLARASAAYEFIGLELLGGDWWKRVGGRVLLEMHQDTT